MTTQDADSLFLIKRCLIELHILWVCLQHQVSLSKTVKAIPKAIPTALSYRTRDICCEVWTAKASNLMYPFLLLILHESCYGGHHERLQTFLKTLNVWARRDFVIQRAQPLYCASKKIKPQNGEGNCPRPLIQGVTD